MKALFFCRGRGTGHAVPDLALAHELPDIDWTFVSYGTGLRHLQKSPYPILDLGLPDEAKLVDVIQKLYQMRPADVVVSHEEPAAMLLPLPRIYMAGWLYPERSYEAQCVALAHRALIWCEPGIFPAQPNTEFVGPFIRRLNTAQTMLEARNELGLGAGGPVIAVLTGSHATEAKVPVFNLIMEALQGLGARAILVNGGGLGRMDVNGDVRVHNLEFQERIERVMIASDVVITVGNKVTVQECAALGVPTISLSPQTNAMDDLLASRIPSNIHLNLKAVTPAVLKSWIKRVLKDPPPTRRLEPTVGPIATKLRETIKEITGK